MNKIKKIVLTSLFAAIVCVATMIIKVPTFGTNGYVNIGDTIVLLSAWMIGGWYGALAAGIGSALADFLNGYAFYVPGTFVIKFLMVIVAYCIYKLLNKTESNYINKIVCYVVSGISAEIVMIAGYFFYESVFLGYGMAAAPSIISNCIQGGTCLVLAMILIMIFDSAKVTNMVKNNLEI